MKSQVLTEELQKLVEDNCNNCIMLRHCSQRPAYECFIATLVSKNEQLKYVLDAHIKHKEEIINEKKELETKLSKYEEDEPKKLKELAERRKEIRKLEDFLPELHTAIVAVLDFGVNESVRKLLLDAHIKLRDDFWSKPYTE